jgi:hypothetical protein
MKVDFMLIRVGAATGRCLLRVGLVLSTVSVTSYTVGCRRSEGPQAIDARRSDSLRSSEAGGSREPDNASSESIAHLLTDDVTVKCYADGSATLTFPSGTLRRLVAPGDSITGAIERARRFGSEDTGGNLLVGRLAVIHRALGRVPAAVAEEAMRERMDGQRGAANRLANRWLQSRRIIFLGNAAGNADMRMETELTPNDIADLQRGVGEDSMPAR